MNEKINSFRGENYYLSNFFPTAVEYNGVTFQNNEAAFQAQKCIVAEEREKFAALNPSEAKHLGRKVSLRKDWEQVKISIMKDIVRAKFDQHPELAEKLIATKDTYLEEGNNWGDRIWGTVNGVGANNLGHILMEIRDEKQKENNKQKKHNDYER